MCTLGDRSLSRSVWVVAASMAFPCCRAIFCTLKATILAVSRSSVAANSSIVQNCAFDSISLAMRYL